MMRRCFRELTDSLGLHHGTHAARAHLDEHQLTAILRNKVDLTARATVIPTDDAQPGPLQPGRGELLARQTSTPP